VEQGSIETTDFAVHVVEPDTLSRTRIVSQLGDDVVDGGHPGTNELLAALAPGQQAVVVFGPGLADLAGLTDIERITRTRPDIGPVLIVDELSTNLLQQALRAGVRDVVPGPTEPQQLLESVARVGEALGPTSGRTPAVPVGAAGSRLITVMSAKGGSGKTVVATNLAVLLAKRSSRPVALIDGDLQFGDVAVMLKLTPQHTMVDAVGSIGRLDAQLVQNLFTRHEPSGLEVLPAPIEPAFADQISADDLGRVLDIVQQFCEYVVIDTPSVLGEHVVSMVERADDVVLVSTAELPSIKNTKLALQTLRMLSVQQSKLHLVMNGAGGGRSKLDVGEVERMLQIKAACIIPNDLAVPQSVNKGLPVTLDAPRSAPSKAFEQLADRLWNAAAEQAEGAQTKRGRRLAKAG
jgi:pilus assembly protein CpaE